MPKRSKHSKGIENVSADDSETSPAVTSDEDYSDADQKDEFFDQGTIELIGTSEEDDDDEDNEDHDEDDNGNENDARGKNDGDTNILPGNQITSKNNHDTIKLPLENPTYLSGTESGSSSDDEPNTVGEIPMRWYDEFEHIGYSKDGSKILRKPRRSAVEIAADPTSWRTIYDAKNDREIQLTEEEIQLIQNIRARKFIGSKEEIIAWTGEIAKYPLFPTPTEPKRRFLPSRHEAAKVVKLVRAIRAGRIDLKKKDDPSELLKAYDIWQEGAKTWEEMTKAERAREVMRTHAPKRTPATHAESYNPPPEYLKTEQEIKEWEELDTADRDINFIPQQFKTMRHVPLYKPLINESFERCLDLYLATRVRKQRMRVDPEDLIPTLPKPRDLRPFPTGLSTTFGPLSARVSSIDIDPSGMWLLSGTEDGVVSLWDLYTSRLTKSWELGKEAPVYCVKWCPLLGSAMFAAAIGNVVHIICLSSALVPNSVFARSASLIKKRDDLDTAENPKGIEWGELQDANNELSIQIVHPRPARDVAWHHKGEYLAVVARDNSGSGVVLHRTTSGQSQVPFKRKSASGVQFVRFHPTRSFLIIATQLHVKIYNLLNKQLVKSLQPGVRWISGIAVHPSGDHILVSSYDRRLSWFDLDLSTKPYKIIRNHGMAIRGVAFHPRLPLVADGSDDATAHVFHAMVYDDLLQNALIVPVKKLTGVHATINSIGILDIAWHPVQPWLFTAGADQTIRCFTDIDL